jgi:hypothetical protein
LDGSKKLMPKIEENMKHRWIKPNFKNSSLNECIIKKIKKLYLLEDKKRSENSYFHAFSIV